MNSIRKKISLGFWCLALMLVFSGLVSLLELRRLGRSTGNLLQTSTHSMELSKRMLDAVQEQNTSLFQTIVLERNSFDETFRHGHDEFESALGEAARTATDRLELDNIYTARQRYYELVSNYLDESMDTDIEWFVEMYKTSYQELTDAIKNYMVSSQHSLLTSATSLRSNAYRAMMPGVITLCVAIVIVLVFAYLLDLYYTRPLMGINKGLRGYITHRIPFNVKMEGRDEIYAIKEGISTLINSKRK
ncbi:MAG: hypothetical protein LUD76_11540 [Alistipes sp.]|nr:hypothetical protein [Alistipes sp.]